MFGPLESFKESHAVQLCLKRKKRLVCHLSTVLLFILDISEMCIGTKKYEHITPILINLHFLPVLFQHHFGK